ncbi:MAG: hypothetical protein H0U94_02855 [Acidobacteria bacterium]|jgi:hypothetical protein|nr:hypothetical protein [Acidobacteriota bacterium]
MDDKAADRRARMTVRRYAMTADADRDDLAYWQSIPPGERVLQAWRLSQEQWRLHGEGNDEPRLCRFVARVFRR